MIKRISLLAVAALMAAMMVVATAAPVFAAQTFPNKKEQTTKETPNAGDGSGQTQTAERKGNTITFTKNAGKSPAKTESCTQQQFRAGTCP